MATENKTETPEKEHLIGEMGVEEFFSTLLVVMRRFTEEREVKGEKRLMQMSAKEFTDFMLGQMKTRAYATAQTEADVALQILSDWQALMNINAVASPYRVRSVAEADQMFKNMAHYFATGGRGALVVAIGVAQPEGGYTPYSPSNPGLGLSG